MGADGEVDVDSETQPIRREHRHTSVSFRGHARMRGLPPGSLVHIGPERDEPVKIVTTLFGPDSHEETVIDTFDALRERLPEPGPEEYLWIDVRGVHEPDLVACLGALYRLHPLVLEDIVNTTGRPRYEDRDDYVFFICKQIFRPGVAVEDPGGGGGATPSTVKPLPARAAAAGSGKVFQHGQEPFDASGEGDPVEIEQCSLVVMDRVLITFQETDNPVFHPVRERLRAARGQVRKRGADYLAYALIDACVDDYFVVLEALENELEAIDQALPDQCEPELLERIRVAKSVGHELRMAIWPLAEAVRTMARDDAPLILDDTRVYLGDLHDHVRQTADILGAIRDMERDAFDMYMSSMDLRLNQRMHYLTVLATIFIPLTFVTSWYGMNFEYMPELKWPWAYPVVGGGMISIAVTVLLYFRAKRFV